MGLRDIGKLASIIGVVLQDVQPGAKPTKILLNYPSASANYMSGGDKLENTNVSVNRLISLILIRSFAYSIATFPSKKIKCIGIQKYVARVKESGRLTRRHSSFYVGLSSCALG